MLALSRDAHIQVKKELDRRFHEAGKQHLELLKEAGKPEVTYSLSGRLYLSKSGWILLDVPNAMVRGLFDALHEPGVELPLNRDGRLNGHVSVISARELEAHGIDPDKIPDRGRSFRYGLGPLKTVRPANWSEMSRVYFVTVRSPELETFRKSLGLSARPNDNKFEFHITVGCRRKKVIQENGVSKLDGDKEASAPGAQTPGASPLLSSPPVRLPALLASFGYPRG